VAAFQRWFPDESACRAYLARLRWPDGFVCDCGASGVWMMGNGLLRCGSCRRTTSVTAGTIFHRSHVPLDTWFAGIWHVAEQRTGVSALGLQRAVGLGSYRTAWMLLHKLRRTMQRADRDVLSGVVQVDDAKLHGRRRGSHGRQRHDDSMLVAVAVELLDPTPAGRQPIGRIRLGRVVSNEAAALVPFVYANVAPGSVVQTDGWHGYSRLGELGYEHHPISLRRAAAQTGEGRNVAHQLLPQVHRVVALLKRWLLGTHQGAVGRDHLDHYLDEFVFRFNRRHARSVGLLFYRLAQYAADASPHPYATIAGGSLVRHA
jgi:hypothetical protein